MARGLLLLLPMQDEGLILNRKKEKKTFAFVSYSTLYAMNELL